jgi:hypothetical protein
MAVMTAIAKISGDVTYFLVQYVPEPFRKEATNVGLIATAGGQVAARFYADPGNDGRVIFGIAKKRLRYPKIYSQWVRFWRKELARGASGIREILDEPQINFRIIDGGTATDTGDDFLEDVATNLYLQLVDEKLERRPEVLRRHSMRLEFSIREELKTAGLFSRGIGVNHPILPGAAIDGACTEHHPSFRQDNGRPHVMQAIGFSISTSAKRISERAGATAFMFGDIKSAHSDAYSIAIVHITDDAEPQAVSRAEKMLASASDQIVHWDSDKERKAFIDERIAVAQSGK